jgi:hypothetical protein
MVRGKESRDYKRESDLVIPEERRAGKTKNGEIGWIEGIAAGVARAWDHIEVGCCGWG